MKNKSTIPTTEEKWMISIILRYILIYNANISLRRHIIQSILRKKFIKESRRDAAYKESLVGMTGYSSSYEQMMTAWEKVVKLDGASFRKLIQKYRENASEIGVEIALPWGYIIANQDGYKWSTNKEEIKTYVKSLRTRHESLRKQILEAEKIIGGEKDESCSVNR